MRWSVRQGLFTVAMAVAVAGGGTASAGTSVDSTGHNGAPNIVVNLSEKILYVYEGDSVVGMYDIADGMDPYPTPRGSFAIRKLTWNPSWVPPDSKWARNKTAKPPGHPENPMKVVKIFFKEPDYYIHGTGDVESLGSAESHGCLRMAPDDVMQLGKWVMDHGGLPQEEGWFQRILHFRREEKVIYLSKPVPMSIKD